MTNLFYAGNMLEDYKILTLTHKRVPMQHLGAFVIQAATPLALGVKLEEIKTQFGFEELMYLPTCNRVLYFFRSARELDLAFVTEFFQHIHPGMQESSIDQLGDWVDVYKGLEAIEHLYQVAASIDSMVIGERQILRQLRDAFEQSHHWGISGDHIRFAVDLAVQAAKSVYTQTRIGDKPISIASLAVQKLLRLQVPKSARILMVGAGQTNALVAKFLLKHDYHQVHIFNRTLSKAQDLAAGFKSGKASLLHTLPEYRQGFDVLIACTSASRPLIDPEVYAGLLQGDQHPKMVIDLSIPNNVSAAVPSLFPMEYIEIEALRQLAKENLAFREKEVGHAQDLLARLMSGFPDLYRQRRLVHAMRQVPESVKAVKEKAIQEVFRQEMDTLDPSARDLVKRMMDYMEKKCIGIPMKAAREAIL